MACYCSNSLLGALAHRGLPHVEHEHKDAMRQLVIGQTAWSVEEQRAIFDYCAGDVDALQVLFLTMAPRIDWPCALMRGRYAVSLFGWARHIGPNANPRSIANFPMQANGADMMRIAAIAATEAGTEVCAPVHDAFLIAAPLDRLDEDVARMRDIMTRAGNAVAGGLDVRTEAKVVRWPDRYMADGAQPMWDRVMRLLDEVEAVK